MPQVPLCQCLGTLHMPPPVLTVAHEGECHRVTQLLTARARVQTSAAKLETATLNKHNRTGSLLQRLGKQEAPTCQRAPGCCWGESICQEGKAPRAGGAGTLLFSFLCELTGQTLPAPRDWLSVIQRGRQFMGMLGQLPISGGDLLDRRAEDVACMVLLLNTCS